MKIAIPHWQGRVSPVFDVAASVLVFEMDGDTEISRLDVPLRADEAQARAARLAELGAEVLICGAISRPQELAVAALGIEVIAQICGNVECVLSAFVSSGLDGSSFLMPGCCGRRRRGGGAGGGGRQRNRFGVKEA